MVLPVRLSSLWPEKLTHSRDHKKQQFDRVDAPGIELPPVGLCFRKCHARRGNTFPLVVVFEKQADTGWG